jgi:hypothetical protein
MMKLKKINNKKIDWMMKLKKKTSIKVLMTKLENLKNDNQNERPNMWEIAIEGLNWIE